MFHFYPSISRLRSIRRPRRRKGEHVREEELTQQQQQQQPKLTQGGTRKGRKATALLLR